MGTRYIKQDKMTNKEKNEQIAKILGFKKGFIKINDNVTGLEDWEYPTKYKYLSSITPRRLPDFIKMLEELKQIKDIVSGYHGTSVSFLDKD